MSFTEKQFIVPNVYSTGSSADGYAVVTGIGKPVGAYGARLLGLMVENKTSSTLYVQLFDTSVQPTNGSSPIAEIQVNANSQSSLDLGSPHCIPFTSGICVAGSSTQWSYTAVSQGMFLTCFYLF